MTELYDIHLVLLRIAAALERTATAAEVSATAAQRMVASQDRAEAMTRSTIATLRANLGIGEPIGEPMGAMTDRPDANH